VIFGKRTLDFVVLHDLVDEGKVPAEYTDPFGDNLRAEGRRACSGKVDPKAGSVVNVEDWTRFTSPIVSK